ncbi:hypothetical protein TanjilG_18118 [Lupinus angustifolius]|uniref:Uncharacterized protein n=1 Tax=Lupinus angustifolius TaxID=3871 RepID=A0A1J7HWD9_LUPAN|nr:PREDICTED: uncharacterized protein LOC109328750 [Lupinus angustifolius]OIW17163.1 hypothetical protein TanjilG_18118 [Lupinus angustifolius]
MEFRSKSCRDENLQIERYSGGRVIAPTNMEDLRCADSYAYPYEIGKELKLHKASKSWSFNDPELQKKKRVVGYKVYAVEGKMKGSFKKSFKWIKNTFTKVVYGW